MESLEQAAQNKADLKKAMTLLMLSKNKDAKTLLSIMESIKNEREQKDAIHKQEGAQKTAQNNALVGAVAAPVGTMAGYYAINSMMNNGKDVAETGKQLADTGSKLVSPTSNGLQAGANAGITQSSLGEPGLAGGLGVEPKIPGTITDTLPPDTTVTPDGAVVDSSTGQVVGRVAQGALGGYEIYQGLQDFKKDKMGGGLGVLSGGANVGAALGSETAASAVAPLMVAKGGYDAINAFGHGGEGLRSGTTEIGAGLGSIGGPLGTLAGAGIGNAIGYGLQGHGIKNDLALAATGIGLPYAISRRLGFDPIQSLMHKTTRQTAQENTQNLMSQGKDNQAWQDYVSGIREQNNYAPPDPSKPFAGGKYASWDEYKKAGLQADDLSGVYGNLNTYGPAYAGLSADQKKALTQLNINQGLYDSDHGEVVINNEDAARKNGEAFFNAAKAPPPVVMATQQRPAIMAPQPQMPPRINPLAMTPEERRRLQGL